LFQVPLTTSHLPLQTLPPHCRNRTHPCHLDPKCP
jgi:hypothetical protein